MKSNLLLKIILILLTTSGLTNSICHNGCLRCGKDDRCLFCDYTSNYIMKEGGCIINTNPDCKIMDQNGRCLMCNNNYFLDISVGSCVSVPADKEIRNCLSYGSLTVCKKCAANSYLQNGKCFDIELRVPGCKVQGKDICLECDKGRILHPSRERCMSDPLEDNCLNYGYLKCNQCKSGFVLNPNYFLHSLFGSQITLDQSKVRGFLNSVLNGKVDNISSSPCQPIEVKNCLVYEDFYKCKQCSQFFYLDLEKNCQPFPLAQIPNCAYYLNYNECTRCNPGFLLSSRTECKAVEPIDKCATYDNKVSANVCLTCLEGYYVAGNICRERTQTVTNCTTYSINNDNCSVCTPGFGLSNSKLMCLGLVPNCKEHNLFSTTGENFPCEKCEDTFYLSGLDCLSGSIANCQVYTNESVCEKCVKNFYWLNMLCNAHTSITGCETYSDTNPDTCSTCENNSVLITQKKSCKLILNQIPNCKEYSSPLTCSSCLEKHTLVANVCVSIPSEEFCLEKLNSNCIKCESGYLLDSGVCKTPFEFECEDCYEKSPGTNNAFTCEKCDYDRIPWKHEPNEYHCIKDSERTGANSAIANCLLYKQDTTNDLCMKCKEGFVVAEDLLSCVAYKDCDTIRIQDLNFGTALESEFPKYTFYDKYFICLGFSNPVTPNCKIEGNIMDEDQINYLGCLKCKDNFVPIFKTSTKKYISSFSTEQLENSNFDFNLKMHYASDLKCEGLASNIYQIGNLTPTPNCEVYTLDSGVFYCAQCKFGYSGIMNIDDSNDYVACEKIIEDCDIDTYYGNTFDNFTKKPELISCHKCLSENKIPFIFINDDYQTKPFEFTNENSTSTNTSKDNGQWLQCLEPNAKSFKMDDSLFTENFPENCGIGYFKINTEKDFRNSLSGTVHCGACKPGFRKVLSNSPSTNGDNYIFKCEKIENCDNNHSVKWLSSCSKCKEGFAWSFSLTTLPPPNTDLITTINYDKCIKVEDPNCLLTRGKMNPPLLMVQFAFHFDTRTCMECKKGYNFNWDGTCSKINTPFCKEGQYNTQKTIYYGINHAEADIDFSKNTGCNECEENYVGYRLNVSKNSCVKDSYTNSKKLSITQYVRNCRHFKLESFYPICVSCEVGFIISKDGENCVRQDTNPNCKFINTDGDKCEECYERYVLIEGFCEEPQVTNCLTYVDGEKLQKCETCEDTFMLVNNNCIAGTVKNCKRYDDLGECTECFLRYQKILIKDGNQYCQPIPEDLNCLTFQNNNLGMGQLFCETCTEGYAPSTDPIDLIESACLTLEPVLNCKEYNNTGNFNSSTLQCTSCFEEFYLKENTCIQRDDPIQNCVSYSTTNNYCISCDDGFYLTNTQECEQFPSGIYGCINYKDSATCAKCEEYMYLNGNTCVRIEVQNRLSNCKYFENLTQCLKCEMNYYLNEIGECELAKAQNCESYKSITECASCPENFGFYEDLNTGYMNCLYKSTPNCDLSDDHFPFPCLKCNKFFYSDEGKCLSNEKFIPACDEYETSDTCSKCENEYILSYDHKKCLTSEELGLTPFESCENNEQTKYPLCDGCQFGYQFYKGQCLKCKTHTIETGCLYCEGIDVEICLVCKPGFYQNSDGDCVGGEAVPIINPNMQIGDGLTRLGVLVLSAFITLFA